MSADESSDELPDDLHAEVVGLCVDGQELAKEQDYAAALELYWAAWDVLPDPKERWTQAVWILSAIGEANFCSQDYAAGRDNFAACLTLPEANDDARLHLRRGQCCFELGELDDAEAEFLIAWNEDGPSMFDSQEPKYLAFLRSRVKNLPPTSASMLRRS